MPLDPNKIEAIDDSGTEPLQKDITDNSPNDTPDVSVKTSKDDFAPIQMGLGGITPASQQDQSAPTDVSQTSTRPETTSPVAETPTPSTGPNQETLNTAFAKYMGSSYNPNSSMDKGKMETVKNALKKFQEETGKQFDINDSEDLQKMRPIMNAAYQSEEYKKVAGVGTRKTSQPTSAAPRQQTSAQRRATAPASPKGGPTYYVRTGFNRYVPAVEADITSGQQLFMQNPNRAARAVYPYVKVDSRPVRRATPAR